MCQENQMIHNGFRPFLDGKQGFYMDFLLLIYLNLINGFGCNFKRNKVQVTSFIFLKSK